MTYKIQDLINLSKKPLEQMNRKERRLLEKYCEKFKLNIDDFKDSSYQNTQADLRSQNYSPTQNY